MKMTSTKTKASSKKRSVSFAKTLKIRFSLALEDYSDQEYEACWYSPDEYLEIEKDMCKQFMKMEQGKVLHDKKSCSRGLEKYLTINAISKKECQTEARQAVLNEQARQAELGECDEEAIARLYNNVSSSCQMWAAVLGRRDQRDAEKYNQDDDDDWDDILTISQESQESSIQEEPPRVHQDNRAPQKSHRAALSPIREPRQVAISARSA